MESSYCCKWGKKSLQFMETEKCKREAFVWGNLQNQAQLSISKIFSTGSVYLHWCKCTALSWSSACLNSWLSAVSQRFWPFLKLFFKVFQTNLRHHPHNNSLLIPYKKNLLLLCLALKKKKKYSERSTAGSSWSSCFLWNAPLSSQNWGKAFFSVFWQLRTSSV